jgi:hypothetical protein
MSRPDDHDVVADEQDLLTRREASARIQDEIAALRLEVQELEAGSPRHSPELTQARARLAALEEAAALFGG